MDQGESQILRYSVRVPSQVLLSRCIKPKTGVGYGNGGSRASLFPKAAGGQSPLLLSMASVRFRPPTLGSWSSSSSSSRLYYDVSALTTRLRWRTSRWSRLPSWLPRPPIELDVPYNGLNFPSHLSFSFRSKMWTPERNDVYMTQRKEWSVLRCVVVSCREAQFRVWFALAPFTGVNGNGSRSLWLVLHGRRPIALAWINKSIVYDDEIYDDNHDRLSATTGRRGGEGRLPWTPRNKDVSQHTSVKSSFHINGLWNSQCICETENSLSICKMVNILAQVKSWRCNKNEN